jgi:hypothetical protein
MNMSKEIMQQESGGYQSSAVQFSSLVIANLMLINSGALFAFPAYLEKVVTLNPAIIDATAAPASAFVLGVVLATLAGIVAYWNYGALRMSTMIDFNFKELLLKYPDPTKRSAEVVAWFASQTKSNRRYISTIWWTLLLGHLFVAGSLVAFVSGCYLTKLALLAH